MDREIQSTEIESFVENLASPLPLIPIGINNRAIVRGELIFTGKCTLVTRTVGRYGDSLDGEGSTRAINQETNNGIEASNQLDALARKMGSPIRNARYEEGGGGASNERTDVPKSRDAKMGAVLAVKNESPVKSFRGAINFQLSPTMRHVRTVIHLRFHERESRSERINSLLILARKKKEEKSRKKESLHLFLTYRRIEDKN